MKVNALPLKVVIIGAGNVGYHLALAIDSCENAQVTQIVSRNRNEALPLAELCNCNAADSLTYIDMDADVYIFCIHDNALLDVIANAELLHLTNRFIAHTSGSLPMSILNKFSSNYGVFYPLQTFSKQKNVSLSNCPFLIESSSTKNTKILQNLAEQISDNYKICSSEQRTLYHLNAVIVNNFTNYLFVLAEEYCKKQNLDFELLKPLILETIDKLNYGSANEMQTGPAKRDNHEIIKSHQHLLANEAELLSVYDMFSKLINKKFSKK